MKKVNLKFQTVLMIFSAFICFSLCFYTFAQAGFEISPYVQNVREEKDGTCSAVIMWVTSASGPARVDYRVFGSTSPWQTVRNNYSSMIHEVKITGLQKGKRYAYKAYDEAHRFVSDERSFYAPIDYRQPFKFAVYSDPHDAPISIAPGLPPPPLHVMAGESIRAFGARLVLTCGDYSDHEGIPYFLKTIDHSYLKEMPLYPVLGNHDYLPLTIPIGGVPYFSLPNTPEMYFSFDYGNCHFIGLHSPPDSTQTDWLKKELENFRSDNKNLKKWLIAYMHIPAYSNYQWDRDVQISEQLNWAPLFEKYGVDLVFSGHVHAYEHFIVNGVNYVGVGKVVKNFSLLDIKNDVDANNNLLGSHLNMTAYNTGTNPLTVKENFKLYKDVISLKITAPKADDFVRGQLQIKGRAMAAEGFQRYELSYARAENPGKATLITSSNVEVKDGILGVWDTSKCANGRYVLTLKGVSNVKTSKISVMVNIGDPLHRFFNNKTGAHFYTANEAEKNKLLTYYSSTFTYEGIACGVSRVQKTGTVPFHRFYNKRNGAHFYTASEAEKNKLITRYSYVYQYEGVACYVYPVSAPISGSVPLYRFWNKLKGCHFYTASRAERDKLIKNYSSIYVYEGIACFVYPAS